MLLVFVPLRRHCAARQLTLMRDAQPWQQLIEVPVHAARAAKTDINAAVDIVITKHYDRLVKR
jgi:hypothetical protein